MPADNPFSLFQVYPDWGGGRARITWEVDPGVAGDNVYLYRSEQGTPATWTRITETPLARSGSFVDETVPVDDLHAFHYYRGLVADGEDTSAWLPGEQVSALSTLTRKEYHIIKTILRREWRDMFRGNGLDALHCITKEAGTLPSTIDPDLGIPTSKACPDDPDYAYGQKYAGGFHPAVRTRVRFLSLGIQSDKTAQDATGREQDREVKLRLLAFPRPREGHMIALVDSDRRYVLTDSIQPFWFKADHPVVWECNARLIDRRDARHKLVLSEAF